MVNSHNMMLGRNIFHANDKDEKYFVTESEDIMQRENTLNFNKGLVASQSQ